MINIITQEFRPQTFKEVAGQDLVKELLKAIVKKPESSPKTLILQGEYGTGKTTCARILARAINCQNRTKDGDACGHCDFCKSNIENTIFYEEFDSAMIGNVNDIKDLKDTFYFDKSIGYKVIVLDEAQLMTQQAQSALLKVLEESISGIFFVLCTTHIDKILPTIRSRSLKLRFDLVKEEDIKTNIKSIIDSKNVSVDDNIISLIANRCQGHLRDAHMLLDEYLLLGEEQFKKLVQSSEELYYKLILASLKGDLNLIKKIIEALQCFPIYVLKNDYEITVLNIIKVGLKTEKTDNVYLNTIVNFFNERIFKLIDVLNNKRIYEMFTSDKRFQAAMYILVKDISQLKK